MSFPIGMVVVVATALAFGFTNGFHDTANPVPTPIATGAVRPKVAVLIAGVLTLVGAFLSVQLAKSGGVALVPTFRTYRIAGDVPTAWAEPVGASA
jgi:PiT family inorganic phosphate transporter